MLFRYEVNTDDITNPRRTNKADLRQGVAVEYVSCEPTESAGELFDEDYEPVEEEQ